MLPIFTIIGRPNVGKSTLFNVLTKTRDALVADLPGLTRDRQYGEGLVGDRPYLVVDTGGVMQTEDPVMAQLTEEQVQQAIDEGDVLLFMVDAKAGLTATDQEFAKRLRIHHDKVVLVVNKVDREEAATACSDFYSLGFGELYAISATQGRGIDTMISELLTRFPEAVEEEAVESGIAIAVVGRPNVGKSTLINRMLGEERVIVYDQAGTTRDSIYIPFERRGEKYTLIDTAGVRRRAKITETIEKFSMIKTLQAMDKAHVVILIMDARDSITEQDLRLLGMVLKMGKALIIAINKWDGMDEYDREQVKQAIDRRFNFVSFARRYFISALHGTGVGKLYHAIDEAYVCATKQLSTSKLTKVLEKAVADHQPPLVRGRRVRLRYAHLGGHHPMLIVIHGKQTESLPQSYQRYLANYFRKAFNLVGIPLQIRFKSDVNPYK